MKIGRNDPCPCGSGKKYKNCCLAKQATPSQSLYYLRLSEAYNRLMDRLLPYALQKFGNGVLDVAMEEFLLWPDPEDDSVGGALDRFGTIFLPWLLFNWEYDSSSSEVNLLGPEGRTAAELYAQEHRKRLDPLELKLIESVNRKPFTFFEVERVDRGKGMRLKNVFQGSNIDVEERSGSEYVKPGDLVFGRALSVDGVGMIMGLGQTIIPPRHKPEMIRLRMQLRSGSSSVTDDILNEWDIEIRDLFFAIDHALSSMPKMCNTDGDPLELHRLIYEVPSAEDAFEKLCGLCVTARANELLEAAKRDGAGRIIRIEFSWDRLGHKASPGMPNTVLGHILIDGHRLTAEVNSAQRAKTLRHEIDSRLGKRGQFKLDEIQDVRSMLSKPDARGHDQKHSAEHNELMQHPEVREHVSEVIGRHWDGWIDQKIPALGGKTPREAAKSADGREAVEALLNDAERDRGKDPFMVEANRKGANRVRQLLGLNKQ
jgi:hypothetical protein